MVNRQYSREQLALQYENKTMVCENGVCGNGVARSYHPYCSKCFREGILKGRFEGDDGVSYRYDGSRWIVCDV